MIGLDETVGLVGWVGTIAFWLVAGMAVVLIVIEIIDNLRKKRKR